MHTICLFTYIIQILYKHSLNDRGKNADIYIDIAVDSNKSLLHLRISWNGQNNEDN